MLLRKLSQFEKDKYCMIPTMWCFGSKTIQIVKRSLDVVQGRGINRVKSTRDL